MKGFFASPFFFLLNPWYDFRYELGDKIHRHLGGSFHLHITRDKMSTTTPQKTSCHGEWTTPVRVRVLEMLSLGYNKSEVSRETGVSRQTIQEWAKKTSFRRSSKQRSGRPHSLTPSDIRHIIYVLWRNWEGRRLCWRRLGQESGCNVSGRTIQRALAAKGYTRCKACKRHFIDRKDQKAHLAYSSKYLHQPKSYWRAYIYGMRLLSTPLPRVGIGNTTIQ